MGEVLIREATPDDAEAVAQLLGELGYPGTVEFARTKLRSLGGSGTDTVVVAEVAGTVVGVLHLHIAELFQRASVSARVMAIVVDERFRRRGVGRRLMATADARAKDLGAVQIELTSAPRRTEAHSFYRSLGFAEGKRHFLKRFGANASEGRAGHP